MANPAIPLSISSATTAELTKLLRQKSDKLDQALQHEDFFDSQVEEIRRQYLDLFCRLMVRNPYASVRKEVVNKMWFRTIYPSIDQYRKQIKKTEMEWRTRFQAFLEATTGTLFGLVTELVAMHKLTRTSGTFVFDFMDDLMGPAEQGGLSPNQRSAMDIVTRMFGFLGDLSRYRMLYTNQQDTRALVRVIAESSGSHIGQSEIDSDGWWLTKKFYRAAIQLAPYRGQAHNQLAVVYGYERDLLEGVFCYYCSLIAKQRFYQSESNLRMVLANAVKRQVSDDVYQGFVYLRNLFVGYQPTRKAFETKPETPKDIALDVELEAMRVVNSATHKLGQLIKQGGSAYMTRRRLMTVHAIHLFELQQLSGFNYGEQETPVLYNPKVARLSALLTTQVAEYMCYYLVTTIDDRLQNSSRIALRTDGESQLLSGDGQQMCAGPLVATLLWIVSACVRVIRDPVAAQEVSDRREGSKAMVFMAVQESGLLKNVRRLKGLMEAAERKMSRDRGQLVSWDQAISSMEGVMEGIKEDAMLAGWRLPDGTVWATSMGSAEESEGHRRWNQLHRLLSLSLEGMSAVQNMVEESQSISAESSAGEEEEEEICFQGRPQKKPAEVVPPTPMEKSDLLFATTVSSPSDVEWDSLLSPREEESHAMQAWEQYQIEQQRKLDLERELLLQQKFQLQLQQQLMFQQQHPAQGSAELDATTASVLNMAMPPSASTTPVGQGRNVWG